jgi:Holliday junction DNA helicase RuvA
MITSIQGVLEARGPDWVQVVIGGVGLHVSAPSSTVAALGPVGSIVKLHTQLQVREDSLVLYGFASVEERMAFLALQTVTGIGPRLALVALSVLTPLRLAQAVESNDVDTLSSVPGVGKKTASRIAMELKGKLDELAIAGSPPIVTPAADPDLAEALQALGYSQPEVRRALASLTEDDRSRPLEERIRRALQAVASV